MCPGDDPQDETGDDEQLFRAAMRKVRPLRVDRVLPPRRRPAPRPRQTELEEQRVLRDMLSDPIDPSELETGEESHFQRAGLQQAVLRRLRRGQYAVEAELDLHGLTADQAREALAGFLLECRTRGRRCVRVIHGKGRGSPGRRPVLKLKVDHWLRQWDDVLAFCTARPVDGGSGALYVLLRRRGSGA